jgi:Stage II sporulation protein E (SpoIIE)
MRPDAQETHARHQRRAPLPPLIRRGWLSPRLRLTIVLGCAAVSVLFVLLLRLEEDPTSWKGVVGGVEAIIAVAAGLLGGRYAGLAVGLIGAGAFLLVIGFHTPPDPVLWGLPILVIWGFAGFLAGWVAERLSESTGEVYAAVADEADTQGRIARALQRSLLPGELPQLPMAEVATLFRPGSFAFAIGDVQGKGAEAAAVTALARHTLRTASILDIGPAAALGVLNEALLRRTSGDRFVTALLASATPTDEGLLLTISCGGHPLPLVRHQDGTISEMARNGPLLGVWWENEHSEQEVLLRHGEVLLAYSDGATDIEGAGERFGEDRLRQVLAGAGARPDDVVAAVHEALTGFVRGMPDDDIAVLALAPRRDAG